MLLKRHKCTSSFISRRGRPSLQQGGLRYELIAEGETPNEQRFRHASSAFHLFVAEAGSDRWVNYVLLRDYLREAGSARQLLSAQKQEHVTHQIAYRQLKTQVLPQVLEAAQAWWVNRQSFADVETVAAEVVLLFKSKNTRNRRAAVTSTENLP